MKPMQMIAAGGLPLSGLALGKRLKQLSVTWQAKSSNLPTGDLINAMVTAALAVKVIQLGPPFWCLRNYPLTNCGRFRSRFIICYALPDIKQVTDNTGLIETFVQYQPFVMSILICMSFCYLNLNPTQLSQSWLALASLDWPSASSFHGGQFGSILSLGNS